MNLDMRTNASNKHSLCAIGTSDKYDRQEQHEESVLPERYSVYLS